MEKPEEALGIPESRADTAVFEEDNTGLEVDASSVAERIRIELLDPYAISKKYNAGGRTAMAREVKLHRQTERSLHTTITQYENDYELLQEKWSALSDEQAITTQALADRTNTVLARIKALVSLEDSTSVALQKEIDEATKELETLRSRLTETKGALLKLEGTRRNLPKSRELLEAYYEKMETIPLTPEEKRELLRPDVLAELSTEEYLALWRRLNPYFLSHVTRQGFRDHNAMVYHSAGLEAFHTGLTDVLGDKKMLRPPIAAHENGLRARDEETVRRFLEPWVLQAENETEAKERLNARLTRTWATAPKYPDETAVHFAAQIVANDYYGGESGNEVFFLYPSDVLASQYDFAFNGREHVFTQPQSETKWNDVFVWPSQLDDAGIPVDAGMVFLPEKTAVDPETGSKYASRMQAVDGEEKRVMIEDDHMVNIFVEWAQQLHDHSPVIEAYRQYRETEGSVSHTEREKTCFEVFKTEIMQLGFSSDAATAITDQLFSSMDGISQYEYGGKIGFGETKREAALNQLKSANANWKLAEQTVPAKEYWERYFATHPEQKPKHIVYYNGDPTSTIYRMQQTSGIGAADTSRSEGDLLGFEDHHVEDMLHDPRARAGYDSLLAMGLKIIEEQYGA